jgi:hypothetical protein
MRFVRSFLNFITCFAPAVFLVGSPGGWSLRSRAGLQGVLSLVLVATALAQSVRWEPAESGMPNAVALVFDNCSPEGQPELPPIPGLTFTFLGRSESMNMINFQTSRSVTLSYLLRGRQNGPVQIPAFTVKTDKGPHRVAAFNAAAPAAPLESVASARLLPEKSTVWSGEVFGLTYELSASRRANPQISPTFDWNAAPLVAEDWSKPEVTDANNGGERRVNVTFRTRVAAKAPNTLKLDAAGHLLSIQTGTIGFGIISQPRMEQVSVTSDQPVIEIKPLPAAPPGFSGAVGQFKLVSKVVPEKAAVGEPVTWTLELSGTGNWPDLAGLPAREVSHDFQVVQPKAKRTPAEGKLFDVTLAEDVVLVPGKAGTYTLGPVSFTYFDPKSGSYKTATAPRSSVTITAPAAPQFNISTQPGATAPEQAAAPAKPAAPPAVPAAPAVLPRDPLPGGAAAGEPFDSVVLTAALLAPVAGLGAFWFWLAWRRARATDPIRPHREARERMLALLGAMDALDPAAKRARLREWQREVAALFAIPHAAPAATTFSAFGRTASLPRGLANADGEAWAGLWAEADRALYGAEGSLPADWTDRATRAATAVRVRGFQPLRLFLPRNLFPFAAALALVAAVGPQLKAEDPLAAYRRGEFTVAEKAWRAGVAARPTDWIARHNLSLVLAQQGKTAEAAAQAAAAFVQQPGHPAARWHFKHAAGQAGVVPAPLAAFLAPDLSRTWAEHHSPVQWQHLLIACAVTAAVALGVALATLYGRRSRRILVTAGVLAGLSLAAGGAAYAGLVTYGIARDNRAVIVTQSGVLRSIPTEADTTQKTTPLAAGTMALGGKTFLGWTQLTFENGQTGWVRKGDIVPLWR